MEIFKYTNIGQRDDNQDRLSYLDLCNGLSAFIVADGIGGYENGAVAAEAFGNGFIQYFVTIKNVSDDCKSDLKRAFANGDAFVKEAHAKTGGTIGTCAVGAIIFGQTVFLAWIGDCRATLVRNGRVARKTLDHTFLNQKRMQGLEPTELEIDCFSHMLSKAIHGFGDTDKLVETISWDLQEGDTLFLSSDGFHNVFMPEILPQDASLLQSYLKGNEELMDDNCTFIRIKI